MSDVGRNDPCPCGSGRKYKRCCYAEDREREARALGGSGAQGAQASGSERDAGPEGRSGPDGVRDPQVILPSQAPGRWGRAVGDIDPTFDLPFAGELLDADGEPVVAITDRFTFPAHKHREVQAALLGAPGLSVVPEETGARGAALRVSTDALPEFRGRDDLDLRVLLLAEQIEILSFDYAVADGLVAFVERTLGGLVQRGPRQALAPEAFLEQTLASFLGSEDFPEDDADDALVEAVAEGDDDEDDAADEEGASAGDGGVTPEMLAAARQFVTRHYDRWLDDPLPALAGRTPRQVARKPGTPAYRELETILKDIERIEGRKGPDQRYDVGILRRALGMPATRP